MSVIEIPLSHLVLSFLPIFIVLLIFFRWQLDWKSLTYATLRMAAQLLTIGYFLTFIFHQDHPLLTGFILFSMLVISSWISLYPIKKYRRTFLKFSVGSMIAGCVPVLILVTTIIIPTTPWYKPALIIPLAGMIFANAMNALSLAAERFQNDRKTLNHQEAKIAAFRAAMIPMINTFFAVGLVSFPGMMTGQILSGVSPLLAVRYQLVVMTMVMGASGLSVAFFLFWLSRSANYADSFSET